MRFWRKVKTLAWLWAIGAAGVGGCKKSEMPAPLPPSEPTDPDLRRVKSFLYQLQRLDPAAVAAARFDLVVMDYSRDGTEATRYTPQEIAQIRNSPVKPKVVLAYLSIGEAESYRWYWQPEWDANQDGLPDPGAPPWLGPQNPDWPGNYKVRYWDTAWQALVLQYLDKIIDMGFDGVYLDIIDAYAYWGPEGESGLNRPTAAQEMIDFVKKIAHHARVVRGKATFKVFPQNAEELGFQDDYLEVVSGIGREDVWYMDDAPRPWVEVRSTLRALDRFKAQGKLVLVIDYPTRRELIDDFYAKAQAKGYIPYAAVRSLDTLLIHPGHEPE